jgi:hypothetical protein
MAQPILTARWSNVCILNFPISPEQLAPYLPPGLKAEKFRGETLLSLVAYEQSENQVFGFQIPASLRFPCLDLRCYVRCGTERGTRLIQRWVPSRIGSWFHGLGFRDSCALATLECSRSEDAEEVSMEYSLELDGEKHSLILVGRQPPLMSPPGSLEHHFKEIRWSFGVDRWGEPTYYEIQHPQWFCYPVDGCELNWDWEKIYGKEWDFLNGQRPRSAVLAVGSEVSLFGNMKLE